jgi:Family of unknown function (DUF6507)
MRYSVNPAGVQHVLDHTGKEADDLEKDLKPLDTAMPAALTACGNSAIIGGALETFLGTENRRLKGIVHRVEGCLSGAALATIAYVHADHAMMRTAQNNAAKAKISHIPAKWQKKH